MSLYKVSTNSSKFLQPSGNGQLDVVNDFSWTLSPKESRANVPYAQVTEYQQTAGQLIASVIYYSKVIQGAMANGASELIQGPKDPADIYKFKYFAVPTNFVYRFPYFNQKNGSRTNQFGNDDNQSPFAGVMSLGKEIIGFGRYAHGSHGMRDFIGTAFGSVPALASAAVGFANTLVPGKFGLENPQSWSDTSEGDYQLSFDLFNTGTVEDIQKNRDLAYILKYQSSPSRRSFCLVDPICIYDVFIPDVTHLPAAYISDLNITNLGNTRVMSIGGVDRIIPDAYRFQITFKSLFMPTRNIMAGLDSGQRVSAITDATNLNALQDAILKGDFSAAHSLVPNLSNQFGVSPNTLNHTIDQAQSASETASGAVGPPVSAR